jgi:regulation of enolase protein 1 (concanavalin A-like superfamily)
MPSSNICRRMAIQPIDAILGVPATFHWLGVPVSARFDGGVLAVSAGPRTDWFVGPASGEATLNAPALVGSLTGDFLLAARLKVSFASTFDAGALVLWQDERTFAKLAFEFSPQGQPLVVSVVTRGESDDCNSVAIDEGAVWLRVARLGRAYAFHASLDGHSWQFVRHFRLAPTGEPEVGFEVQSPIGEGCSAEFHEITYTGATLADLRSGV